MAFSPNSLQTEAVSFLGGVVASMNACNLAGLFILFFLGLRLAVAPQDRKRAACLFCAIVGSILLGTLSLRIADALTLLRPIKYDLYIYRIDAVFGFHPSFAIGRSALQHRGLYNTALVAYAIAPMVVSLVYGAYLWFGTQQEQFKVIKTFALNLLVAPIIYLIVPVAGPKYAFPGFPFGPGLVLPAAMSIHAAPNGIPSVHFSTALLVLFLTWKWTAGKVFGPLYLSLMFVATLASGQHYLVDLVAAVPYAVGIRWMAGWRAHHSVSLSMPAYAAVQAPELVLEEA